MSLSHDLWDLETCSKLVLNTLDFFFQSKKVWQICGFHPTTATITELLLVFTYKLFSWAGSCISFTTKWQMKGFIPKFPKFKPSFKAQSIFLLKTFEAWIVNWKLDHLSFKSVTSQNTGWFLDNKSCCCRPNFNSIYCWFMIWELLQSCT